MVAKKNVRLPKHLLILDAIGTIILAFGLIEWIGDFNVIPESLQFNYYNFFLIAVGIIFMLPLIFFIINGILGKHPREI